MKPCDFIEDQTKCTKEPNGYAPKSPTDETCWRYRVGLEHCNWVSLIDEGERKFKWPTKKRRGSEMRTLDIGMHRFTAIRVLDKPGDGGACHSYHIGLVDLGEDSPSDEFGYVKFQKGPVKENEVNGCFMEDLIAICIDRLRSFQAGEFACTENGEALVSLERALHWLNHRTRDRQARGVEGKSVE